MTDAELSRDLALALGYYPESVSVKWKHLHVYRWCARYKRNLWFRWDYRDPSVCLPLLEWLAQPYGVVEIWPNEESWSVRVTDHVMTTRTNITADTLPQAVARAVIAVKGAK